MLESKGSMFPISFLVRSPLAVDQLRIFLSKAAGAITGMDRLTLFGLVAVTLMLAFYALEGRSRYFVLAFGGACVMGSVYGFLQGAWPLGLVEGIWSVVAIHKWWIEGRPYRGPARGER